MIHLNNNTDEIGVGFLVKCSRLALEKSGKKYKVDSSRSCDRGDVYAYLSNENADDVCTMFSQESSKISLPSLTAIKLK